MDTHVREREKCVPSRRQALGLAGIGLVAASSLPVIVSPVEPLERARAAWLAFASAMNELSAPGDGWMLTGAGAWRASHGRPAEAWIYASRLAYAWQEDSRLVGGRILIEHVEPLDIGRQALGYFGPGARA
ncbi:hypothetical protein NVS89_04500 [Ancylobacter sp. MQZ15Z-1]|uniref:Uncharacterized protein n=1 Tax=Ancylobacter mangrovi TaxID=2972472 RepID=A0A9X2T149_9HYPH|nr:hypothetical protein [Ancylobacter mangrovi]MCS0494347.1 hypothetical protein [Ancylobacter mangrovi]